jgi:hypothetical protein
MVSLTSHFLYQLLFDFYLEAKVYVQEGSKPTIL